MITHTEALEIIQKEFHKISLRTEEVDILDSINRILAEDVIADVDLPSFDNSAMDGYAVIFSARNEWNIIGEVSAGNYSSIILDENDAVVITTGSKIPINADTIIPLEDLVVDKNIIRLKPDTFFRKGMNIRTKGNDLQKGQIAVKRFAKIDAKTITALASCGKTRVTVFNKLTAAILATGDELLPINEIPFNDKFRVSNTYSLYSAVKEVNHLPIMLGFVKDDKDVLRQNIKDALGMGIDFLFTTGGVSVGKYDFLKDVFEDEGVKKIFWGVNIKPGKPFYFGIYEKDERKVFVFGLPGNPVSALVNFYVLIKPAIDFIFHQNKINTVTAVLQNDLIKKDGKRHFSRGILYKDNDEWKVSSLFSQSSGNLVEMSRANCLIIIEEESRNPVKGEKAECILI